MYIPFVLAFLCLPIWFSLGDHSFNGRSGARYGIVAQEMATSNDWVVPRFLGHPHLTKPPLIYWLEAGSIELFGQSYYAVRIPSAISGTLVIFLLYWFASRFYSTRAALFACAIYAIMPMTIMPARMTVTDSLLNLSWFLALAGGYLVRKEPERRRWVILFWVGSSLGMLTKGPVMFIPMGMVFVWWWATGQRTLRARQLFKYCGFTLLSMLPVLIWALVVIVEQPESLRIWMHETVARAVGQGDHSRPIWFFIPVLFAGCFPASAMLLLPGINLRWKDAWRNFISGSLIGYLGWACIAPFVVYSLISGKLPSYLLPICAPLALLSATVLERWCTSQDPAAAAGRRLPEVRWGLMVGTLLFLASGVLVVGRLYGFESTLWFVALAVAFLVSILLVVFWRNLHRRTFLLAAFFGTWILGWIGLEEVEDIVLTDMSYVAVAQRTFGESGWEGATAEYRLNDAMVFWDQDTPIEIYDDPEQLQARVQSHPDEPLLVLTRGVEWEAIKDLQPSLYQKGQLVEHWHQWPGAPERYLVVFHWDSGAELEE